MHTIQHKRVTLASSLVWSILDPYENKHKQIGAWRDAGQTAGVSYSINGETVFGRTNGESRGVVSLAALAGRHPSLRGKTALLLIEIPSANPDHESTVVVVGLLRGVVEIDKLVPEGDVAGERNVFAAKAKQPFDVYGSGDHIGNVDHELDLDALIKGGGASASTLKRLSSGKFARAALLTVLAVAVGAGSYTWISSSMEAKRLARQAQLEASRTPEQLYLQSIEQYLLKPVTPLAEAIATLREALSEFPTVQAGWELGRLNCSQSACSVAWRRIADEGGTIEDFRAAASPEWGPITAISQTEVVHSFPVNLPSRLLNRDEWPVLREWRDQNVALWQFLAVGGWRADVSEPKMRAVPVELDGGPEMHKLRRMPQAIRAVELNINNQPWWYADSDPNSPLLASYLGDQLALDGDIQIDVKGHEITFKTKGILHVRD